MWHQSRFRSTMLLTMFTYKGPFGLGTLDTACSAASACSAVSSSQTCYWGRIDWMIINWSFSANKAFLTAILSLLSEVGEACIAVSSSSVAFLSLWSVVGWEIQGCILSPDLCVVVQGCIKACIDVSSSSMAFLSLWSEVGWEIQGCIFSPDLCVVGQSRSSTAWERASAISSGVWVLLLLWPSPKRELLATWLADDISDISLVTLILEFGWLWLPGSLVDSKTSSTPLGVSTSA